MFQRESGGSLSLQSPCRSSTLRYLVAFCFSVLCGVSLVEEAVALNPGRGIDEYVRDVWEKEQGLPNGSLMTILQTRDGYLWLGTHGGLARFDGVSFTLFLKDQHIVSLLEDRDGALWIATWGNGLVRYHDEQFFELTAKDGLAADVVRCLYQTRDGTLWIGTNGGLTRFSDGSFSEYTTQDGLSHEVVRALHEDVDGTLWIGTDGGGLSFLKEGTFVRHMSAPVLEGEVIRALQPTRDGRVWIATNRGLKSVKDGKLESYTRRHGLPHDDVIALHEDRDGQLWIGTRQGLSRFHNGRLSRATAGGTLGEAEVRALFEDREGSLWVGTYLGGVNRLKDRAFASLTRSDGLSEDNVRALYEDREGALWIGTHNGGVNRVHNGRVTVFTRAHGLPSDRVWSVMEDAAGTIWLGTLGGGLARYSGGRFQALTTQDGLPSDIVRCLLASRDGSLWIGTDGGLVRLHGGRLQLFDRDDGLGHLQVLSLHEAADGTLWIGTRGGLNRLRNGVLDVPPRGADPGIVFAIHEDADSALWLGTRGRGLWRLKNDQWTAYSTAAGLADDTVLHILEDDDGRLWLSSPSGVFRVDRRELLHPLSATGGGVIYDRAEGMESVECNGGFQPAGVRTRDGRLWFPTLKGVAVIDPKRSPVNTVPPPVRIDTVRVGSRRAAVKAPVRLEPGDKALEIAYAALSFVAPEKVRFRYKLDGFDEEWVEAGTRRTAYYTTLPPGDYRFRVMARNNSGYWSETEASVDLTVLPRFYQTWWFLLGTVIGLGLLIRSGHRVRMRRARERFAVVIEERYRIAREIHDGLAQGLAVVGLQLDAAAARLPASDGDAAVRHHLAQARRQVQASLVEATHSILDLRSPGLDVWDLRSALASLVEEVSGTGAVEVSLHVDGDPRQLPECASRHLLRIAQEAVSNTLKHARAQRVEIALQVGASDVRLTVKDDGCGFDPSAVVSRKSFGLAGMRERAELMKAELGIERRAEGGMEIVVWLPVRTSPEVNLGQTLSARS